MELDEYVTIDDLNVQSDIIKTGNGNCGYIILPKNLCGCNPGKYGGYEYCDKTNCPLENVN